MRALVAILLPAAAASIAVPGAHAGAAIARPGGATATSEASGPARSASWRRPVFYVSPRGRDRNSGRSVRAPWRTLQKAMDAAPPGALVLLRGGRYFGGTNDVMRRSGWRRHPTTFKNYRRERVVVENQIKITGRASYVRFVGLTVQHASARSGSGYGFFVVGSGRRALRGVAISRCTVRRNAGGGIYADYVLGLRVTWCRIYGNGRPAGARHGIGHGMYLGGRRGIGRSVIRRNVVWNNQYGRGIQLYSQADRTRVTCNKVANNAHRNETGGPGIQIGGDAVHATDRALVRHNIVTRNAEGGIGFNWAGPVGWGNVVSGNLAWANSTFQFERGGAITWRWNHVAKRRLLFFPRAWRC